MRILVTNGFEASSQWAHAINTVKMAQGFSRLGHEVTIVCHQAINGKISNDKLAEIYGLTEPIRWVQLPNKVLRYNMNTQWRFGLLSSPVMLQIRPDLVFARHYIAPWLSSNLGIATVAESHAPPDTKTAPFFNLMKATHHKAFHNLVTISHRLANHYQSLGVPKEKLLVLPDAVDLQNFQPPKDLPLSPYPTDKPNIAYVGHLYDYKGIPTVIEAAALLPDAQFHFVGGWENDIERQKQRARELNLDNVTFHGLKPQVEVPNFLWNADVLLLPPSQYHPSAAWTSPVKLGEYLASKTPVVATDIPALRDWLTDEEVEFVTPDDAKALAVGIKYLLKDRQRATQLQVSGFQKAQELSYKQRAATIINSCQIAT